MLLLLLVVVIELLWRARAYTVPMIRREELPAAIARAPAGHPIVNRAPLLLGRLLKLMLRRQPANMRQARAPRTIVLRRRRRVVHRTALAPATVRIRKLARASVQLLLVTIRARITQRRAPVENMRLGERRERASTPRIVRSGRRNARIAEVGAAGRGPVAYLAIRHARDTDVPDASARVLRRMRLRRELVAVERRGRLGRGVGSLTERVGVIPSLEGSSGRREGRRGIFRLRLGLRREREGMMGGLVVVVGVYLGRRGAMGELGSAGTGGVGVWATDGLSAGVVRCATCKGRAGVCVQQRCMRRPAELAGREERRCRVGVADRERRPTLVVHRAGRAQTRRERRRGQGQRRREGRRLGYGRWGRGRRLVWRELVDVEGRCPRRVPVAVVPSRGRRRRRVRSFAVLPCTLSSLLLLLCSPVTIR
ncbi:hypothetical protein PENSPDRAFT_292445 [Peniophora sp. CONT]|nr:hypothetical protein PENSPDRAFT_292445 [Peniophora sp. CONT]